MANSNEIVITALKFPDNVREAPEIYIDNINHGCYEIIDNAVDEHIAGYCNNIEIDITDGCIITVKDDGRGLPTGKSSEKGLSMAELAMSTLSAGGKFKSLSKEQKYATGGKNGVGSSCVNALAEYFNVFIKNKDSHDIYGFTFEKGKFTTHQKVIDKKTDKSHGTKIVYKPDPEIYNDDKLNIDLLKIRLQQYAYLNPGLSLILTIDNNKDNAILYKSKKGLSDYLEDLIKNKSRSIKENIIINKEIDNDKKLDRPLTINCVFTYTEDYSQELLGFVNGLYSEDGGDHINSFNAGICKAIREYAIEHKFIKSNNDLETTDTYEGISGIVSIKIKNPKYSGQNKRKLDMPEVRTHISNIVYDTLLDYLNKNPKEAEIIIKKALRARKERESIKRAKEVARGLKKVNTNKTMTLGKLADCSSNNPEECELYLVEGDSAAGSAKLGRDPKTQAILPIFGKILNVIKAKEKVDQIIKNEKLGLVIAALGCGFGKSFDISKIRYNKIIPFADADVDGGHIICLWITFFWKYYPELIKQGYIYTACPPLYRVIKKGLKDKYYFTKQELENANTDGCTVNRMKGLGEMSPQLLWDTTMNPENRRLNRVTVEEAEKASEIIDLLMGDDVGPRKKFIYENSNFQEVTG